MIATYDDLKNAIAFISTAPTKRHLAWSRCSSWPV